MAPLLAAGYSVLSEESGLQHPAGGPSALGAVVVDPLDGSTNASLGLPWCATSLCLVVDGVPTAAMVANLATGRALHRGPRRAAPTSMACRSRSATAYRSTMR